LKGEEKGPKKTTSNGRIKQNKRKREERILEDSESFCLDIPPSDPKAQVSMNSPTPVSNSSNVIEYGEVSSGWANGSLPPAQPSQQNVFENIPQFPKIESFEMTGDANVLPQ